MIAHDLKPFRKCASLFVIPCCDKILHDTLGQLVEILNLFLEKKSCVKKSDVENLENLFLIHGIL